MNQCESGFCQKCHAFVELSPVGGIADHGEECPGRFHAAATLTFGAGWVSWTVAANSYARNQLVQPISPETWEEIQRMRREN